MPEIQRLINTCKNLMKALSYYKRENKNLEAMIDQLRTENKKLREENVKLSSHQQFPR